MSGAACSLLVGMVPPHDRVRALELVFSHFDAVERARHIAEAMASEPMTASGARTGDGWAEGLIGAWRGGRLVGAVFSQIAADRTAIIWLPRLVLGEPLETAGELCTATWALLAKHHVRYAQSLLSAVGQSEASVLRMGGLGHIANLLYLASQEAAFPLDSPAVELELQAYQASRQHEWGELFEATCEGTLDCANLPGVRHGVEVLAGYRTVGEFDPNLWLLARYRGQSVGCLMLARHARQNNMELQYLGLIPAVRGRGFGKQLARHAQWLARLSGCRRLVLAVDAANKPAIQTYMATGFQMWQRRRLYVRKFRTSDDWHTESEQFIHVGDAEAKGSPLLARMPN